MTQEEKQLLLKDLCERLPYGVKCRLSVKGADVSITEKLELGGLEHFIFGTMDVKPYLRPMSSMTVSEELEFTSLCLKHAGKPEIENMVIELSEFYNKKHLDYRGLIEKGLALEAPENMYD